MTAVLDHNDLDTSSDEPLAPREQKLLAGITELSTRIGRGGIDGERLLFLIGAVAVPLGLLLMGIGWYGAGGTGLVFEQVPYLISGGVIGLAFVLIGCTLYACWWITRSIREDRERHAELMERHEELAAAVRDVSDALARLAPTGRRR